MAADSILQLLINDQPLGTPPLTEWQTLELSCVPPSGATLALSVGEQALEAFLRPGDPAWRWRWNPQNAVGRFPLLLRATFPDATFVDLRATLDVAPRKLDLEHYHLLLEDVQHAAHALAYALSGGSAGASARPAEEQRSLLEEHALLFGERFDTLARAVERIARHPHSALRPSNEQVDLGQARDFSRLDRGPWAIDGAPPADTSAAALPAGVQGLAAIVQTRSTVSADTYENRLLKRLLEELGRRARLLGELAAREGPAARALVERSAVVSQRLRELRALPFLAEVGPFSSFHGPSQILQRDPAYRTVYRCWQDLRRWAVFAVESPLFHLPLQDLPRLYECWCALQVFRALLGLPGAELRTQRLVTPPEPNGQAAIFTVQLIEDTPLLVLFWRGARITLRYQPRYKPLPSGARAAPLSSLDRHTRVPDLSIEIEHPDAPLAVLLLDAKYRLDAGGGVPEDALADAYTYLGSIGRADGARAARAAVLLYPGLGPAELYPSGVGALPLLPAALGALHQWLEREIVR